MRLDLKENRVAVRSNLLLNVVIHTDISYRFSSVIFPNQMIYNRIYNNYQIAKAQSIKRAIFYGKKGDEKINEQKDPLLLSFSC